MGGAAYFLGGMAAGVFGLLALAAASAARNAADECGKAGKKKIKSSAARERTCGRAIPKAGRGEARGAKVDPLYAECLAWARVLVKKGSPVSALQIQRRFRTGSRRATQFLKQMERDGIPVNGN